jgi:hypothetical protein
MARSRGLIAARVKQSPRFFVNLENTEGVAFCIKKISLPAQPFYFLLLDKEASGEIRARSCCACYVRVARMDSEPVILAAHIQKSAFQPGCRARPHCLW